MFEIKQNNDLKYLKLNKLEEYGFKVIFSTRIGGYSKPPFESLNLGFHTEDKNEIIRKNRVKTYENLNLTPDNIIFAEQIHSNNIKLVNSSDKGSGVYNYSSSLKNIDGLISTDKSIILGGLFADCVPIYIMDKTQGYFALIHAGWKGTYNNILLETINFFKYNLKSSVQDLLIAMGPSIAPNNYEVSFELIKKFKDKFDSTLKYYIKRKSSYWLDLKKLNKSIALDNGIKNENLYISKSCTFENEKLFYSYRRDSGTTGRMAAFLTSSG
ncbi:MAG: peptidoglycan editing factor PgeF [Halanaerobiales bacterium]|nr:peptidoglycan editing factor PgeF [Halanaerobiales bacterium]